MCCGKVVDVDIVVRLRCKEILVPDDFLGKGSMREETAITVNWEQTNLNNAMWDFSRSRMFPMPPSMMAPSVR